MYDTILFPTDGSDTAESVLEYAIDVADEHDAEIHVLYVADTDRDSLTTVREEVVDSLKQVGEHAVAETADRVRERGLAVHTSVLQGDPSRTIVDYAAEAAVDLVVMSTHGRRGVERALLGSVTERVVNTAPVPVVVVNPDTEAAARYPARDVLVPTDGSPGARRALAEGIDVATATGATLHLLHVVETGALGPDVRSVVQDETLDERAEEIIGAARDTAEESVDDVVDSIAYGHAHREIRDYVEGEDIDLLVLGTQGQTEFGWYTLGGVSSKLVRSSPVPLVMTRVVD